MNKQIKNLLDRAISESDGIFNDQNLNQEAGKMYIPDHFAIRFAELIAEKCADLCADSYHTGDGYGITCADQRCAELIKESFGVEK